MSYLPGTMVLRTIVPGTDSLLEVTDHMPWDGAATSGRIVRRVRVLRGPAEVEVVVATGPALAVATAADSVVFDGCTVRCGFPLHPGKRVRGSIRLDTGEGVVVTIDPPGSRLDPLSVEAALLSEERGVRAWRRVSGAVSVSGPFGVAAARSALVVTALSGAGGAPVSSPVTSLPRVLGGERNRDGRLVSPVTAASWARIAGAIGLAEESDAAAEWLAGALELEPPLPLELAVDGDVPPSLSVLPLAGFRRSQPVVAGTDRAELHTVEASAAALALAGTPALRTHWRRVVAHADWVADHWADPDASVWGMEPRDRRWTAARLVARHGLLAATAAARAANPLDLDAAGWRSSASAIESWLLSAPLSTGSGSGLASATDAGLARMGWLGPWPADDPVVLAALDRIADRLGSGPWIHAYPADLDDGYPGTEPPSVVATLWLATALARAGRTEEAMERVEAVAGLGGELHLLPDSVDSTGPLGNIPSAAAHVAFIEATLGS